MDYEVFLRERITHLRLQENISEYKLSRDLNHSNSYIYNISAGRSLPPLKELFDICDYFHITPQQFFDTQSENPIMETELIKGFRTLNEEDQKLVLNLVTSLKEKNTTK